MNELLVTVNGEYDINTIGTYEVEILAVDSSKNTSRKNVVIDVIEKEKEIVEVPGKGSSSGTSNNNSNNSGSSGGSSSGSSSGGSSNNSSGGSTGGSNNTGNSQPFLETPGSITVGVNSSIDDLFFKLQQGLNSSGTVSITVSEVNLSVQDLIQLNTQLLMDYLRAAQ